MERISQLLYKYLSNALSEAEYKELMEWVKTDPDNQRLLDRVNDGSSLDADLKGWLSIPQKTLADDHRLEMEIGGHLRQMRTRRLRRWIPYAAAAVLILAVGIRFLDLERPTPDAGGQAVEEKTVADIDPGSNRATLTLADGRSVNLSDAKTGIVIGDVVAYSDGSKVLDADRRENGNHLTEVSPAISISTPKGGAYQVTLSDGTKVWINSASTLKCPSHFSGKERVVEVSGEAYFDVARDAQRQFKVISNGQEIRVLGTEFNISAYSDESEIKTTLVNGAVMVVNRQSNARNILNPGEQCVVHGGTMDVRQVDAEPYISWKSGYFCFRHTPFTEVMRQLARWYNVDVVYKSEIPRETFSGGMDRDLSLSAVLKLLNVSAVKVQIEPDNKLIVY